MLNFREQIRQLTLNEIMDRSAQIVLGQGLEQLTLNRLAREMGITPPAVYRYYNGRNHLISALVTHSYNRFGRALEQARDGAGTPDPAACLYRVFLAHREWAVSHPSLFGLFSGPPGPDLSSPNPITLDRAGKVHRVFTDLYTRAWEQKRITLPRTHLPPVLERELIHLGEQQHLQLPPELIYWILDGACRAHGMIFVELSGRFSQALCSPVEFYTSNIGSFLRGLGMDPEESR